MAVVRCKLRLIRRGQQFIKYNIVIITVTGTRLRGFGEHSSSLCLHRNTFHTAVTISSGLSPPTYNTWVSAASSQPFCAVALSSSWESSIMNDDVILGPKVKQSLQQNASRSLQS